MAITLAVLCIGAGCHGGAGGGTVVRFGIRGDPGGGEDFVAVTSDSAVLARVREQLALPQDQRRLHINGAIQRAGSGQNLNWRWRFEPNRWTLAEMSMELCDGKPSMVERDLANWVDKVKRFCPWASYVKGIESARAE